MDPQSTGGFSLTGPPTDSGANRPEPGMTIGPGETAPGQAPVSRAGSVSTGDDAELQPLLRSRMILIGVAGVAQWAIFALGMIRMLFGVTVPDEDLRTFWTGTVVAAIYGADHNLAPSRPGDARATAPSARDCRGDPDRRAGCAQHRRDDGFGGPRDSESRRDVAQRRDPHLDAPPRLLRRLDPKHGAPLGHRHRDLGCDGDDRHAGNLVAPAVATRPALPLGHQYPRVSDSHRWLRHLQLGANHRLPPRGGDRSQARQLPPPPEARRRGYGRRLPCTAPAAQTPLRSQADPARARRRRNVRLAIRTGGGRDHATQPPWRRAGLRLRPHQRRPFLLRHGIPARAHTRRGRHRGRAATACPGRSHPPSGMWGARRQRISWGWCTATSSRAIS